jgi:hypothetical protein
MFRRGPASFRWNIKGKAADDEHLPVVLPRSVVRVYLWKMMERPIDEMQVRTFVHGLSFQPHI